MGRFQNLIGKKFGRLSVVARAQQRARVIYWKTVCDCGATKEVRTNNLTSGHTKSCGCIVVEMMTTHGLSYSGPNGKRVYFKNPDAPSFSKKYKYKRKRRPERPKPPEYKSWQGAIRRCHCKTEKAYSRYGGRGIVVCERWLGSYDNFLADMGPRPPGSSLDRIDNDGNYEPGNCRWASPKTQARNKGNNRLIPFKGKLTPLTEVAEIIGMNPATLNSRLLRGWTVADAVATKLNCKPRRF